MNVEHSEHAELVDEVMRYLAAVDVFRALGCEPCWRPETARDAPPSPAEPPTAAVARRTH